MSVEETIKTIRAAETMPELDALRTAAAEAMMAGGRETFDRVQREFIKAKNRLKRVPVCDRSW